jgi:hypothetical protein
LTLSVTWGTGSSARTWSLRLPDTATLVESVPAMARVSLPNPATVKRALGIAEPFLTLGAEAVGAGVPELLLVVAAVAAAKHMLSQACPGDPKPAPTSSPAVPGTPYRRHCDHKQRPHVTPAERQHLGEAESRRYFAGRRGKWGFVGLGGRNEFARRRIQADVRLANAPAILADSPHLPLRVGELAFQLGDTLLGVLRLHRQMFPYSPLRRLG